MLYVLAIICPVVGISHHLPCPTKMQDKLDSSPHPSNSDDNDLDDDDADDNSANNNTDNNNVMQMTDNNTDVTQRR